MNIKHVEKRDGMIVEFDSSKITNAIASAMRSVDERMTESGDDTEISSGTISYLSETLTNEVIDMLKTKKPDEETFGVEEIQDTVECVLIKHNYPSIAKEYITYRQKRTDIREGKTVWYKMMQELTNESAANSNAKRENGNIDGDTAMGTMLKYGSMSAKEFYLSDVIDTDQANAHRNGDIHIHDLDFYTLTTTCTQIDLKKLFTEGFSTGHGYLRPPQSITSYSALACIAIQSNQNDQHGGQAIPKFDYDLADGVRKTFKHNFIESLGSLTATYDMLKTDIDDTIDCIKHYTQEWRTMLDDEYPPMLDNRQLMDEKEYNIDVMDYEWYQDVVHKFCSEIPGGDGVQEVISKVLNMAYRIAYTKTDRATYQAMEALIHNLNTMNSRAGAQVPFSSINYGTDTSPEGRMVIKNVLLAQEAGLGNGETPIFPIHIFKVKEGINFNADDPNYDLFKLAMRVSAKRLFPNFSFIDAPFNKQYYKPGNPDTEIAYMGCRTRVIGNDYDPSREIVTGRGNLSFTSINLPRLAINAHGDIDKFFTSLDDMMTLVVNQLLDRFKIQCAKTVKNYPFLMGQGVWIDSEKLSVNDTLESVLKHGTLAIGFIGLAECLIALTGKHHGESEESQELGLKIVKHMRERTDAESKKHKLNFGLLATPAEGLSGRFVNIDKKIFGEIKGVTDKDYYTNSFHVPVYHNISAAKKIDIEAPYHELTNGGHITYIELDGDPTKNLAAFERIIRYMHDTGVGYGAINHPVDRDPECGYVGIIDDVCPKCGKHVDEKHPIVRIRRITGYLVSSLDKWNNAKRAEERDRVKHN